MANQITLRIGPLRWESLWKSLGHESESEVAQSCPTLCDPVDCSPPCSSVHGILQARVLEWVAISFTRGSSWPRDRTQVSCIVSKTLYRLSHQGSIYDMKSLSHVRLFATPWTVAHHAPLSMGQTNPFQDYMLLLLLLLLSCFSRVRLCATP